MRPIIGITTRERVIPSSAGESRAHTLNRAYSDSVLRAGGVPVLLAPVPDVHIPALLDRVDGVILTGGGDIEPERYGGDRHESMYGLDFDRDEFELEIAREVHRRRQPTFAICRGLQVVNVALGGTLIEDIPTETGSADHTAIGQMVFHGHQRVDIEPGTLVAAAIEGTTVQVNSIHHQAVRTPGIGLRPVAWAPDGIVEALQHEDEGWPLLAVQWHPEYLGDVDDEASHRLFCAFVAAAAEALSRRRS